MSGPPLRHLSPTCGMTIATQRAAQIFCVDGRNTHFGVAPLRQKFKCELIIGVRVNCGFNTFVCVFSTVFTALDSRFSYL